MGSIFDDSVDRLLWLESDRSCAIGTLGGTGSALVNSLAKLVVSVLEMSGMVADGSKLDEPCATVSDASAEAVSTTRIGSALEELLGWSAIAAVVPKADMSCAGGMGADVDSIPVASLEAIVERVPG